VVGRAIRCALAPRFPSVTSRRKPWRAPGQAWVVRGRVRHQVGALGKPDQVRRTAPTPETSIYGYAVSNATARLVALWTKPGSRRPVLSSLLLFGGGANVAWAARYMFGREASQSTEVVTADGPSDHGRAGRGDWPVAARNGSANVRRDASRCPYGVQTQLDTRSQQSSAQRNQPLCSHFPRSPLADSNRRPLPYHGSALPTELRGQGGNRSPRVLAGMQGRLPVAGQVLQSSPIFQMLISWGGASLQGLSSPSSTHCPLCLCLQTAEWSCWATCWR